MKKNYWTCPRCGVNHDCDPNPSWEVGLSESTAKSKKVNEAWVQKWAQKIDRLYVGNRNMILYMLEELGIEVVDK